MSAGAQRFCHIADGLPKMQSPRFFFIQPPIPKHNRQSSCNDTNPATGTARRGGKHITFSNHNVGSRRGQTHKDIGACKSPAQLRPTSRRHPTHSDTITFGVCCVPCSALPVSQSISRHYPRPRPPPVVAAGRHRPLSSLLCQRAAPASLKARSRERTRWLGMSALLSSVAPVFGEVSLVRSHSVMASRS